MKRRFIPGLVLAAAFTLTNCSEQLVSPEKENDIIVDETVQTPNEEGERIPYEIFVNDPVTKTISNSNGTYWVKDTDKVTIYTKAEGASEYTCQGEYTYAGEQKFTGSKGTLSGFNYWYCIYPSNSATVGSTNSSISSNVSIGAVAPDYTQTQTCVDSRSHIAGEHYPMFGTTSAESGVQPRFTNTGHLSALVAVKIANSTDNPITINQIALEATNSPIVGDFTFGFNGNNPTLAAVTASTSKKAVLKVLNDGDVVPANSEGLFYLAVAPVEDDFSICVNGTRIKYLDEKGKSQIKYKHMSLESGKLTTIKVTISELQGTLSSNSKRGDVEYITWSEKVSTSVATVNGTRTVVNTVPDGGEVMITGTLGDFLGATKEESILPISFYAATAVGEQSSNSLSKLSIDMIDVLYIAGDTEKKFADVSGSTIYTKFKFPTSFDPSSVGFFSSSSNNLILFNESDNHYYLSEEKANGLMSSALKDAGFTFDIADIRNALYYGEDEAMEKVLKLAVKLMPGQFDIVDPDDKTVVLTDDDGNILNKAGDIVIKADGTFVKNDKGKVLLTPHENALGYAFFTVAGVLINMYDADPVSRVDLAATILDFSVRVHLKTTGPVALWGMNIQSKDGHMYE